MTEPLRVVFAGTPPFAASALAALVAAGFSVPLVLTQPDRPAGRGMKLAASAVKQFALAHGLAVAQPPSLRRAGKYPEAAAAALDQLHAIPHDVMVVAAYGLILPQEVLDLPAGGCLNIHASLLPRWRGAAPIQRALQAGDEVTGITLMQMDAGLDTGAIIEARSLPIEADDTTGTLTEKLAALGASLVVDGLRQLQAAGRLPATAQPAEGATYAAKILREEAMLDWRRPAVELARQIRAFDPFPGAAASLDGKPLKIWAAHLCDDVSEAGSARGLPGEIVNVASAGVTIACGDGALLATHWQKPGGKRLGAREFSAGFGLRAGQRFDLPG
jgi:methionyl-tRNA formyltransferase